MGKDTNIAWTKSTLNLAWGCSKVTRECTNCYMYRLSERFGKDPYTVNITRSGRSPGALETAIRAMKSPMFVNSMSDTFHKDISDHMLDFWFAMFQSYPQKQFQILTKRPERALDYFRRREEMREDKVGVPANCWIGVSVGIREAKYRIDILNKIDARIRFLSCEPLLEDLGDLYLEHIDWLIIGGESDDTDPRPMDPQWAENIVEQCRHWYTKVFFKQMGGKGGDGAGGDLLNGRRIQEMPI